MRAFLTLLVISLFCSGAFAQGTPPVDPEQLAQAQPTQAETVRPHGSPPAAASSSKLHQMNLMIRKQINKAIDGKPYPSLENWRPLSTREKFDQFLIRTYSPSTFAAAGVDALKCSTIKESPRS